jgi:hypothetical protein
LTTITLYSANFADAKYVAKAGISCFNSGTSTSTVNTIKIGANRLAFVGATAFVALASALF